MGSAAIALRNTHSSLYLVPQWSGVEGAVMGEQPSAVLTVVDRCSSDIALIEWILREHPVEVRGFGDVDRALQSMVRQPFRAEPQWHVLLINPDMPGRSIDSVLRELNECPELASMPVILFLEDGGLRGAQRPFDTNANAFVNKAQDYDGFCAAVDALMAWFSTTNFPAPQLPTV